MPETSEDRDLFDHVSWLTAGTGHGAEILSSAQATQGDSRALPARRRCRSQLQPRSPQHIALEKLLGMDPK